jgi:hypothetical protein
MMAKPLKLYLLFQWENGHITYMIISSINTQEQTYIWINNDEDLIELHHQVCPILEHWFKETGDKKHSHIKRVLQTATNKGLSLGRKFKKNQITTYQEFYFFIYKCPQITLQLDLQWPQETQKMPYLPNTNVTEASIDKHQDTPKVITASPTPSIIPTELHIPQLQTHLEFTPKIENPSQMIAENISFIHATVYNLVESWVSIPANKNHPFQSKWAKAKYKGIPAIINWNTIKDLLLVKNMTEYIEFFLQCPGIANTIDLKYDATANDIIYKWIKQPTLDDVDVVSARVTKLHNKFLDLTYTFQYRYVVFSQKWTRSQQI